MKKPSYWVYIVQSERDSSYYIGMTTNIERRIQQHNTGLTKYLKSRIPVKLVYIEEYETKTEALRREKRIKSYKGGEAFKKLIEKWHGTRVA